MHYSYVDHLNISSLKCEVYILYNDFYMFLQNILKEIKLILSIIFR